MTHGAVSDPPPAATRVPFESWWAVSLLLVLYITSVVDRGVITMLVVPIQADLDINDGVAVAGRPSPSVTRSWVFPSAGRPTGTPGAG